MIELTPPDILVAAVLDGLAVGPRVTKVKNHTVSLVDGENQYKIFGAAGSFMSMPLRHPNIPAADDDHLKYAYDAMKVKGKAARALWNIIENSTPHHRCSLCMATQVFGLDHHLPQKECARFSIVPVNLVPVCTRCNNTMSATIVTRADTEPLHPYYDRLGGFDWIGAKIVHQQTAPIVFSVDAPTRWTALLTKRVENHFQSLGLNEVWSISAAALLSSIRSMLRKSDPAAARELLLGMADSYEDGGVEPWLASALRAWAGSDWFYAHELKRP